MGKTRKSHLPFKGTQRAIKLRPDDGVRRHPDERGVTLRDMGGNKLVDVVSPDTGFCLGVRSPLTSDGVKVRAASTMVPKKGRWSELGDSGIPERRADLNGRYVDFEGRVVRTVDMPDGPMPCNGRINIEAERERKQEERLDRKFARQVELAQKRADRVAKQADRAANQGRKLSRVAQGCVEPAAKPAGTRLKISNTQCDEYIRAKGYGGDITDEHRKLARRAMRVKIEKGALTV